ncbi:hypothetical protein QTJ05_14230 [Clostridium perfringens]|nr:hypothetical protein [Clostridium perfringens]
MFLCIVEIIISKLRYDQSNISLFSVSIYYFVILIYFIISYYNVKQKEIIKIFINISLVLSIILIIQFVLYEKSGIAFLKINVGSVKRFGEVRISEGAHAVALGIILSFSEIIKSRKILLESNIKNILNLILGFIEIIFIAKTRSILVILIISIIFMLLYHSKGISERIKIIFMIIISSIILMNSNIVKKYDNLDSEEKWSTIARKGAIEYYLDQVVEKPLFGVGIINPSESIEMHYYARGPLGIYYRDDVGIIGFLNAFGLVGLIWYISLVYKILKIISVNIKKGCIRKNIQIIGLGMFLSACSFTIIFTDPQRIYLLPFVLYMIEEK